MIVVDVYVDYRYFVPWQITRFAVYYCASLNGMHEFKFLFYSHFVENVVGLHANSLFARF